MICTRCPRNCLADREAGEIGLCGASFGIRVGRVMLHPWEEPCLGEKSGAIFFSHCPLSCVYCQNQAISRGQAPGEIWDTDRLAAEMLSLQKNGAENIDLVSPTQYAWEIRDALAAMKDSLQIPVVWNTGGYERAEVIRSLGGLVDIFLTDFKYGTPALAEAYSGAPDYPEVAARALSEMHEAVGDPIFDGDRMKRGILLRHLVLPGGRKDSIRALSLAAQAVPPTGVILSLMRQYTPDFAPREIKTLTRRVTTFEYEAVREHALSLGFDGYSQDADSATAAYTPEFAGE